MAKNEGSVKYEIMKWKSEIMEEKEEGMTSVKMKKYREQSYSILLARRYAPPRTALPRRTTLPCHSCSRLRIMSKKRHISAIPTTFYPPAWRVTRRAHTCRRSVAARAHSRLAAASGE